MSSAARLHVQFHAGGDAWAGLAVVRDLVVAGWTGRDAVVLERHIAELGALGVARPKEIPCFYRVAANLLTTSDQVEAVGPDTSGEVEAVIVALETGLWVGVGSDHTDRRSEAVSVALSKQACAKPVAAELWNFSDVAGHWDRLVLRSWALDEAGRRLYQEGTLGHVRPPEDLTRRYLGGRPDLPAETAMFCGTIPTLHAVRAACAFEFELEDPVLKRKISHAYRVKELPRVG